MTTLGSQSNILKEVYEKGKVRKLAHPNIPGGHKSEESRQAAEGKIPPFLKNRKVANVEDAKKAKGDAARRRLAMMRKNSGK